MNFASLKKLPILFVCENNDYAIHSRLVDRSNQIDLYKFAESHNIPACVVKESNIFKLRNQANKIINEIRHGSGPQYLETYTYRWLEHVGPGKDWNLGYRSIDELKKWEKDDQVEILGKMLTIDGRLLLEKKINKEISAAMKFAQLSPFPGKEELHKHVYK